jgi:hypothetical protein
MTCVPLSSTKLRGNSRLGCDLRTMEKEDSAHPILPESWRYEIVGIRLDHFPMDGGEPFLDLTLQRGAERRILRFWSPIEIEIEKGGPSMTSGFVIRDIRGRQLEGIGVLVDDFEASCGAVRFLARTVDELSRFTS